MRPILRRLVHIALIGAVASAASSCALVAGRSRAVVALDEAFAASRPGLAARLQDNRLFGSGPTGIFGRAKVLTVALSDGAGKALDAAIAEERKTGAPCVLVTSPLIAKAILSGGSWKGDPPLLVPEWHGATIDSTTNGPIPGLWSATSDPVPAYAAAGAAAGAFIAALAKEQGSPSCGILFSEAPSRPRAALSAFAAAYAEASDDLPLKVRELSEDADAPANPTPRAPGPQPQGPPSGPQTASAPAPISTERAAQNAVAELLGSDIRVLFVALGSASGAAIEAAARPGVAIGADFPSTDSPASLAFRITPDDRGLAESLAREGKFLLGRSRAGGGGASMPSLGSRAGASSVPSLLVEGPAAPSARAAKHDFAYFLSAAARRRPARPRND